MPKYLAVDNCSVNLEELESMKEEETRSCWVVTSGWARTCTYCMFTMWQTFVFTYVCSLYRLMRQALLLPASYKVGLWHSVIKWPDQDHTISGWQSKDRNTKVSDCWAHSLTSALHCQEEFWSEVSSSDLLEFLALQLFLMSMAAGEQVLSA
jgi:hypothetical protein